MESCINTPSRTGPTTIIGNNHNNNSLMALALMSMFRKPSWWVIASLSSVSSLSFLQKQLFVSLAPSNRPTGDRSNTKSIKSAKSTINCRCRLIWMTCSSLRLVAPPARAQELRRGAAAAASPALFRPNSFLQASCWSWRPLAVCLTLDLSSSETKNTKQKNKTKGGKWGEGGILFVSRVSTPPGQLKISSINK